MTLTDAEIIELEHLYELRDIDNASKHLWDFTKYNFETLQETRFHKNYYEILNAFAEGRIKKLIVSMPPQHGKSTGSSEMLPAYMFGKNPNLNIALMSYSATQSRKFNRKLQRVINKPSYSDVFPETLLSESGNNKDYIQTADEFEIVNSNGSFKSVGRGGALTGNPVDVMIMDDMYKDVAEGNSPVIRENVWDCYTSVIKTRLHNDSQELIVFTRWHEDDLIGRIQEKEEVITITSLKEIKEVHANTWVKINFEALKESESTEIDLREEGEALWEKKHSKVKLNRDRKLDPSKFNCLHQGNPTSAEGLLYEEFNTYSKTPNFTDRKNYTDTADKGTDVLCSVSYGIHDNMYYVLDVLYTQESMKYTEEYLPQRLIEHNIKTAEIESNNGGEGFARVVQKAVIGRCSVKSFHQSQNKESRIITNSNLVNQHIVFPADWSIRWPEFYNDLTFFKKVFKANKQDGAPDVLTGIIEKNQRRKRRGFIN